MFLPVEPSLAHLPLHGITFLRTLMTLVSYVRLEALSGQGPAVPVSSLPSCTQWLVVT